MLEIMFPTERVRQAMDRLNRFVFEHAGKDKDEKYFKKFKELMDGVDSARTERSEKMGYSAFGFEIPERMMGILKRYLDHGVEPGGFLRAVLRNDLVGAVSRADSSNLKNLPAYAYYMCNHMPQAAYGSVEAVENWITNGGLNGTGRRGENENRQTESPEG